MRKIRRLLFMLSCISIMAIVFAIANKPKEINANNNVIVEEKLNLDVEDNKEDNLDALKSQAELWLEENIGWIFGIPVGTIITAITSFVALSKKSKQIIKEGKENSNAIETIKKEISVAKSFLDQGKILSDACKESIEVIDERFDVTDELIKKLNNKFEDINLVLDKLSLRISGLEQMVCILSSQNEEFVKSGKTEMINKVVKG